MRLAVTHLSAVVFVGLLASLAPAKEACPCLSLARFIPDDAWMFFGAARNPEREWVDRQEAKVFKALKSSGIDRDIISLVLSLLDTDESRAEAQATLDKAADLIKAVRWSELFGNEMAFAERVTADIPSYKHETDHAGVNVVGYEYLLLTHGTEGSADPNFKALVAILHELASMTDELAVSNGTFEGVEVWSLAFKRATADASSPDKADSKDPVPTFKLFRKGGIVGLAAGLGSSREVFSLLGGKAAGRAIVDTPRFKKALAEVNAPETAFMFFDVKMLLQQLRRLFEMVIRDEHCDAEEAARIRQVAGELITLCDVVDYTVTSIEMDSRRELTHTLTRIQEGKENAPFARVFLDRKPFERFDRYVPAEATGFSMNAMVDIEQLYGLVVDFIAKHVPEGADAIAEWNEWLGSIGFDPQADLFSWWSGETIRVSLPPAVVTPMSRSDFVLMVRVKDAKLAQSKVNAAIGFIQGKLQARGHMLMVSPADVRAEGFQQVTHPLVMMAFRPVIGVKGDWLMIGASASAINKCLAVAAGEAPSIMENKRFREEGLIPNGPVLTASFTDTSNLGNELAAAVGMAGMVGGMVTAAIPNEPPPGSPGSGESRRVLAVIKTLLSTAMKLGPVLQKLDFYSSESCVTTTEGGLLRAERVVAFKEPPAPDAAKTVEASSGTP